MREEIKNCWILSSHFFGLGFTALLCTIVFLASTGNYKEVCFLTNLFGEAQIEEIVFPAVLLFCLIGLFFEMKKFMGELK